MTKPVAMISRLTKHYSASPASFSVEYIRLTLTEYSIIVQELCESRGGRPGLSVLEPSGFRGRKELSYRASAIGHNLSLICQLTSEDNQLIIIIRIQRLHNRDPKQTGPWASLDAA